MRRFCLVLALVLGAWACAAAEGWDDIYAARLNAQATWLEAKLALRTAEVAYDQYMKPYLPIVSIATSTSTALGIDGGGFTGGALIPSVTLANLFGADLSFKAPLTAVSTGGIDLGNPSLSLTRKLFVETEADRLDAEAGVLTARAAIRNSENAVRIALATDILNAMYYQRLLEANRGNLGAFEKMRKAAQDKTLLRALDRRLLEARKSMLIASNALADVDDDVKKNADSLYEDVLRLQTEWTNSVEAEAPTSSLTVHALELSLKAAERRAGFSILPYLPNPSLTASLAYDMDTNAIEWGLSFSIAFDAIDKGQHALSALKRREYPGIFRIKLKDAKSSLVDSIRKTNEKLASLELDRKIQELNIADAEDEMNIMEKLYSGGFTSEENLVITRIDLSIEKLLAQKIDYDILIQRLNLANYYNVDE
ncbi:MAG: TolC family protein [Spirochaetes bacterium]|nr:TolC family protein [Spirochaetota bacterium]